MPRLVRALISTMIVSPPQDSGCSPSCASSSMTRWGLALALSILLIATMMGTPAARAWLIASLVCGITPSSAATTKTTMSVTWAPRARMAVNASWPGVSRKVIFLSLIVTWYAPVRWVMPPASPAATSVWRMRSSSVVLPWSTWPRTATTGGRSTMFLASCPWTTCCTLERALGRSTAPAASTSASSSSSVSAVGHLTATPSSSPRMTAVSWSIVCVIGAMMPYCIRILIKSIGLRCISVARSRTVMAASTVTSLGSGALTAGAATPRCSSGLAGARFCGGRFCCGRFCWGRLPPLPPPPPPPLPELPPRGGACVPPREGLELVAMYRPP